MVERDESLSPRRRARKGGATPDQLREAIDTGRTGDKISFPDPAAAPLGTDDEAAGQPITPGQAETALREELRPPRPASPRPRPLTPNIQLYRPQLTSVLSIGNRITGVFLGLGAVGLVAWLVAGAVGPTAYAAVTGALFSIPGQIVLFFFTFAFFFHLAAGIRHLMWDTVHGFELRDVYISGWITVAASMALTVVAWLAGLFLVG